MRGDGDRRDGDRWPGRWASVPPRVPGSSEPGATGPPTIERRSLILWSLGAVLVVVVVVAALRVEPAPRIESGSAFLAWEACQAEVLGRLREPDTAVFPASSQARYVDRDPRWIVTSIVDADNAFGEVARERWVCTVEFGPSGARLLELDLTPVPSG